LSATLGRFSPGTLVSSINKTDRHDITEILLKVVLNTITLTPEYINNSFMQQVIYNGTQYVFPQNPFISC